MGVFTAIAEMKQVFPTVVTNQWINEMARVELTDEQRAKPYAKYYDKDMAPIPQADLDLFNGGPVSHEKALPISRAKELLEDGYLETEVGYGLMQDGTSFAATKVFMPDVTPEMIDWWFNWHPLEGLRYMIWCPVAHTDSSAKTPEAHKDTSGVPLSKRNIDRVHYPVEGFNVKGAAPVEIAFRKLEILGITPEMMEKSSMKTFEIATCIALKPRIPINVFFHAVREVPGGIEFRSRYWINQTVSRNKVQKSKVPLPKSLLLATARNNCIHSLTEYNNLASILPQLYHEQQGLIL